MICAWGSFFALRRPDLIGGRLRRDRAADKASLQTEPCANLPGTQVRVCCVDRAIEVCLNFVNNKNLAGQANIQVSRGACPSGTKRGGGC